MQKHIKAIHRFSTEHYNLLLFALSLLFIFRPENRGLTYEGFWKFLLILVLLTATFNCRHSLNIRRISVGVSIPVIIFSFTNLIFHPDIVIALNVSLTIAFMSLSAASILSDIILNKRVTLETLKGVVCAYMLIGFIFGYAFYLCEFLLPGSIHFANFPVPVSSYFHFLSEMFYFSFVTLLTIGYGDIVGIRETAQTLAVAEGIIGQFYMAILVAKLISIYGRDLSKTSERH